MSDCNEDSSLSSDSESEQRANVGASSSEDLETGIKSRQLKYYYRKTENKVKRRYKRFATQENSSKQLKSYHLKQLGTTAASSIEYEPSLAQRSHEYHDSDNKDSTDDEHNNTNANEQHGDQTDTSSDELSASTSSESDSEITDDENEGEQHVQIDSESETVSTEPKEEPLYEGSKISKVLAFVLIVSFVLKHNLSKAAWTDLLRLLTALLGEQCKKTFQSVYKRYFSSKEPTKIDYCANCFSELKGRCQNTGCRGGAVSSFLDLHFAGRKNQRPL